MTGSDPMRPAWEPRREPEQPAGAEIPPPYLPPAYPPSPPPYLPPALPPTAETPAGHSEYPVYPVYPAYPAYPVYPARPPGTNGKAIAALVAAAAGIICCGLPSIVGLVLGILAMRETRQSGQDGFGLAVAAVVISTLLIAVGVVYLAFTSLVYAGNW